MITGDAAQRLATLFALISPDGTRLIHPVKALDGTAVPVLAVRRLDGTAPVILGAGRSPFWSANSQSVAFVSDGALMKIAAEGGVAVRIASVSGVAHGGSWLDPGARQSCDGRGLLAAGAVVRPRQTAALD